MTGLVAAALLVVTTIGVYVLLGTGPTVGLIFLIGLAVLVAVRRRLGSTVVFIVGVIYFIVPLFATLQLSFQARPPMAAYTNSLADPNFVGSLLYSFLVGVVTIVLSIAFIVPTAYWVRLKAPAPAAVRGVRDPPAVRHPAGDPRLRRSSGSTAGRRCR